MLLATFCVFAAAVLVVVLGVERWSRLSQTLRDLQQATSQIWVRGAFALLMAYAVIAARFGLEAILGAFVAGVTIRIVDQDPEMTHQLFRPKLEGAGYGVFVPFFFVSTGLTLDIQALVLSLTPLPKVPLFLACLLIARSCQRCCTGPEPSASRSWQRQVCCRRPRSASPWSGAPWACILGWSGRTTTRPSSRPASCRSLFFPPSRPHAAPVRGV